MTRINTNTSSLIAQNTLGRTNAALQTALTRLSTGLRINSGKDDPAGLIAAELLRMDIRSIQPAIKNSQQANLLLATADSALGQISSLLNDIRGLVVEVANTAALSSDQIAANQLQVDSALAAIDRIAQSTTFQGRRLLDGSLSFITTIDTVSTVKDLQVEYAQLGSAGKVKVDVDILSAATKAEITNSAPASTNTQATATLKFAAEAILTGFNDANTDILVRAKEPGASFEGIKVQFVADSTAVGSEYAVYDADAKTLSIHINNAAPTTAGNVVAAINALPEFEAVNRGNDSDVINGSLAGDRAVTDTTEADFITITAAQAGPDFNNVNVKVVTDSSVPAGSPTASYDPTTKELILKINDSNATNLSDAATAINNLAEFSATASSGKGDDKILGSSADKDATANTETTGGGVLLDTLVLKVTGKNGSQTFTFESGASVNQIEAAVNLVSDATGVKVIQSAGTLKFLSTDYGSDAFVDIEVISEGAAGTFKDGLSAFRATGTDIKAVVNGIQAKGQGNTFSINTAALSLTATVKDGDSTNFEFEITGGGAQFQLGPQVISSQQARLGINSVLTSDLGGATGKLFQLASGGAFALDKDPATAAKVLDEAIRSVANLRGRIGAFQRNVLDTNIAALEDTLANLTETESQIRDADFAAETAALTRAQILVQSGTAVLAIANSSPQSVLSLFR